MHTRTPKLSWADEAMVWRWCNRNEGYSLLARTITKLTTHIWKALLGRTKSSKPKMLKIHKLPVRDVVLPFLKSQWTADRRTVTVNLAQQSLVMNGPVIYGVYSPEKHLQPLAVKKVEKKTPNTFMCNGKSHKAAVSQAWQKGNRRGAVEICSVTWINNWTLLAYFSHSWWPDTTKMEQA